MKAGLDQITLRVRDLVSGISVLTPVEGGQALVEIPVFVENAVPLPDPMPEQYILVRPLADLEPDYSRRESYVEYYDEETGNLQQPDEPMLLTIHIFTASRYASVDHQLAQFVSRKVAVWHAISVGDETFDTRRLGFLPVEQDKEDRARFVRCYAFQVLISISFPEADVAVGAIEEVEVEVEPVT